MREMKQLIKTIFLISVIWSTSCEANHNQLIKIYAKKHGIELSLAHALIEVESNYDQYAVSNKGALGYTQIIYKYHHKRCGLKNKRQLFNPAINLNCGFKILKHYIDICNGIENGLACYNAGKKGSSRGYGFNYARKVLRKYEQKRSDKTT